jgi:glycosyltransferase involved in cell wall biosynthesis
MNAQTPVIIRSGKTRPEVPALKDTGIYVVIPSRNDELTLGSKLLKGKLLNAHFIVVDDNSTDRTCEIALLAGADIISLKKETGKASAILTGLQRAYDLGCTVAVLMDGDSRYKIREIPSLAYHVLNGEADLVIGSRYLDKGGIYPVKQQIKQAMLPLPDQFPRHAIPTDPLSGFMAFSRKGLESLDFPHEKTRFHQNLIAHFIARNLVIKEVVISERPSIPVKQGWDYSATVIAGLPAYNEESALVKIIPQMQRCVDLVVVVDDGSTDGTAEVAALMGAYVIRHPKNAGYGAALQTIFTAARDLDADALVILDSDGQHHPGDAVRVLTPLKDGADVVIGSRFLDTTTENIPRYRKAGMKVLDTATAAAGVRTVTDTQSGFRAYGKKAISVIDLGGTGMSAGSEILIQISDNNLKMVEVPITVRYDIEETSTENPVRHGISVLYRIVGLISYRRPLPAFGIPGVLLIIGGLLSEIWVFTEYYRNDDFHYVLAIGSAFVIIVGMLLAVAAVILNYLVTFVERQKKGV